MAPSINGYGLSSGEGGVTGCEESDHLGNLINSAGPSHGVSRLGVLHELEWDGQIDG